MAKSARASSRKANNQKLKKNVFGPVEAARTERLSAKLLELVSQPKPRDMEMEGIVGENTAEAEAADSKQEGREDESMDVDSEVKTTASKSSSKKRIQKRRSKKSSIVFPKYKDRVAMKKRK